MFTILFALCFLSAANLEQDGFIGFFTSSIPDTVESGSSVKDLAKKMYKKKFRDNNANSVGLKYDLESYFETNLELKTGFAFENIKLLLNSNLAEAELMYSALDNKINLRLYKDFKNSMAFGISNERSVGVGDDLFLFNLFYKF